MSFEKIEEGFSDPQNISGMEKGKKVNEFFIEKNRGSVTEASFL